MPKLHFINKKEAWKVYKKIKEKVTQLAKQI
jgi:hypothetical protein